MIEIENVIKRMFSMFHIQIWKLQTLDNSVKKALQKIEKNFVVIH